MAQNTLKQKAREFAKTHSVSYLTALKAVDEPLHELRDLVRIPRENNLFTVRPHFRLVGTEGIYSPAFGDMPLFSSVTERFNYHEFMDEKKLSRFEDTKSLLRELGRRLILIEDAGADDIWSYRALQRGGLLGEKAPVLEPFFHHFTRGLFEERSNIYTEGPELGVFAVAISMLHELEGPFYFPVTRDQLKNLATGNPAGELWTPRFDPGVSRSSEQRRWSSIFVLSYKSTQERWGWGEDDKYGGIRVFFEDVPEDEAVAFEELGLDIAHFKRDRSLESVELHFTLMQDRISVSFAGKEVAAGSYQNLIFV